MRQYKRIKQTRRQYIREKRKAHRDIKNLLKTLRCGAALHDIYGTPDYFHAVVSFDKLHEKVGTILKNIKC